MSALTAGLPTVMVIVFQIIGIAGVVFGLGLMVRSSRDSISEIAFIRERSFSMFGWALFVLIGSALLSVFSGLELIGRGEAGVFFQVLAVAGIGSFCAFKGLLYAEDLNKVLARSDSVFHEQTVILTERLDLCNIVWILSLLYCFWIIYRVMIRG